MDNYIYGVVSRVNGPPPHGMGKGVGTRIRYTHCISTLCRLSTLPQYYKPPPHHRGAGNLYTTTIPQTTPTPQGGGNPLLPPPMGGGGGTGQHCTIYIVYWFWFIWIHLVSRCFKGFPTPQGCKLCFCSFRSSPWTAPRQKYRILMHPVGVLYNLVINKTKKRTQALQNSGSCFGAMLHGIAAGLCFPWWPSHGATKLRRFSGCNCREQWDLVLFFGVFVFQEIITTTHKSSFSHSMKSK